MTDPATTPTKPAGRISLVALRVSEIKRIDLVEGTMRLVGQAPAMDAAATAAQLVPELSFRMVGENAIIVVGRFGFKGLRAPAAETPDKSISEESVFFEVDARYEIEYVLEAGKSFEPEDAHAFARVNGLLNLQPFWREYVADCLSRAGLVRFFVPVFNPVKMAEAQKQRNSPPPAKA